MAIRCGDQSYLFSRAPQIETPRGLSALGPGDPRAEPGSRPRPSPAPRLPLPSVPAVGCALEWAWLPEGVRTLRSAGESPSCAQVVGRAGGSSGLAGGFPRGGRTPAQAPRPEPVPGAGERGGIPSGEGSSQAGGGVLSA